MITTLGFTKGYGTLRVGGLKAAWQSYIALLPRHIKILPVNGGNIRYCQGRLFDQTFDLPFDLKVIATESFILHIMDLVTFTCGTKYLYYSTIIFKFIIGFFNGFRMLLECYHSLL